MSETRSGGRETGRVEHTDRRADAAEGMGVEWLDMDDVSAQEYNGSVRTVWPQPFARRAGVEHTTRVTPVVHMPTGALVSLPPGVSLDDFLAAVAERKR